MYSHEKLPKESLVGVLLPITSMSHDIGSGTIEGLFASVSAAGSITETTW